MCRFFSHYVEEGSLAVDNNISSRILSDDSQAPPVRSYALIISVSQYPNFRRDEDKVLAPAKHDLQNLIAFFKEQKFEEIIVLENDDATRANIEYFLRDYLKAASKARGGRSRIVFAFSGHGAPGSPSGTPGSIVLSHAKSGSDSANIMELNELAPLLKNLANNSYHFLALIGSCYSGGIFGDVDPSYGQNHFFPKARGGHALSATTSDDLAYGLSESQGSLFFDSLIEGVNSGWADPTYAGMVSFRDGKRQVVGGGIARLGEITGYISGKLDQSVNPVTGRSFPQIRSGSLYANAGGAFFFLVPKVAGETIENDPRIVGHDIEAPLEVSLNSETTGSAVQNRPDIKVFSAPDSYPIIGLDVSHHSGKIKWQAVKNSGATFAYMKATEGGDFVDPRFKENWDATRSTGLDFGGYHVVNFCKDAATQFANIKRVVPLNDSALPVVIDLEWLKDGPSAKSQRACAELGKARSMLRSLAEMVRQYYGKRPVMFAHEAGVKELLSDGFNDYPLWLQDWTKDGGKNQDGPTLSGVNPWTLWQYAGNTPYASIKNTDVNAFFGTAEQYEDFKRSGENVALNAASPK
jgi:lysozyme